MILGFRATHAIPWGNSASACESPSIAHFEAQGATSGEVERPQPELKFTMTPLLGNHGQTKCRIIAATP